MSKNPFGVEDVPDPDGEDVAAFAAEVELSGGADDDNAAAWPQDPPPADGGTIEGEWASRWNGEGFEWQVGHGTLTHSEDRVFIIFDWEEGAKQGLIEARPEGEGRLVGRYLNLDAPEITRPWVGRVVDEHRIDGRHSGGRIDFRR